MSTHLLVVLVGSLVLGLWVRRIGRELRSGKLFSRGSAVYALRHENPMLFWSGLVLEAFVALFVLCLFVVILIGTKK